jgi:tetratricopeptide (TPR) repeat protein
VLGIGLWRLWTERRGVLWLIAAWAGPMLLLPLVFVGEGMFDQWFVTAYLPLAFATAAGFAWLARRVRVAFPASIATAVAWMILANYGDLNFRHYDLAQLYGELLIQPLPPNAIYVASTDDGAVIPMYLQRIRDVRRDVKIVHGEFVGLDWYDRRLERDYGVKPAQVQELVGRVSPQLLTVTAIANANVAPGRPVFSERPPDPRGLRPGLSQAAAGVLWKTAVDAEAAPDLSVPRVDPFAVARQRRRARGIFMRHTSKGAVAQFEPYENRLIGLLVQAKMRATEPLIGTKPPEALKIFLSARNLDPSLEVDSVFQYNFGLALYLNNQFAPSKEAFERVLDLEPLPARETLSHFYLAEIARAARQPEVAQKHYARALEISGAEPLMMKNIRIRAGQ